jgi:hypothetical protein
MPSGEDRYKCQRTEAEITAVMHRRTPSSSSNGQEAASSPDQRILRNSKEPIREASAAKKKKRMVTPPCRDGGINIRDSLPWKHRAYVGRAESDGDSDKGSDPEDKETLSSRIARHGTAAPSSDERRHQLNDGCWANKKPWSVGGKSRQPG